MVPISVVVRTLFSRFLLLLTLIVGFPVIIFMMVLPESMRYQNRFLFWCIDLFFRAIVWGSFVPVSFKGREHIPAGPVVYAANHQSSLDVPLVGVLARGKPHIWLAKHDLMEWKLLRWVLPRLAVLVDASSQTKAMRSMINLMRIVEGKNIDIMIFPEGGRYPDEKVHQFYGGFVTLAKMLNRPVVPVYISGVNKVYPPDTFWVYSYPIVVTVGEPFTIQEGETDEAFKDRVYNWFVEQSKGQ